MPPESDGRHNDGICSIVITVLASTNIDHALFVGMVFVCGIVEIGRQACSHVLQMSPEVHVFGGQSCVTRRPATQ
jgi:hypothetical protein